MVKVFSQGRVQQQTVEERTTGNGTEKKIVGVLLPHIKKEIVDVLVKVLHVTKEFVGESVSVPLVREAPERFTGGGEVGGVKDCASSCEGKMAVIESALQKVA